MSRSIRNSLVTLCAVAGSLALGCKADTTGLSTLTVAELAARLIQDSAVTVCDANSAKTRSRYGTIPGARLLSNYRDYDPGVELPADKSHTLVFYCHSEMCGAAASAARKAVTAGYTNVHVLPAGIAGWAEEGQPIEKPAES
jgi:rhodanese-related sulfurtransferase